MYSLASGVSISISNCDISCNANRPVKATDIDPFLKEETTPAQAGAFFIQDASTVTASNSVFHNCYQTSQGAIFYLKSTQPSTIVTTLIDNGGTTYKDNQAKQGGVIFCDMCNLNLQSTLANPILMTTNYA